MFCKNCGSKINEDSKFCPGCGMAIQKTKSNLSGWKIMQETMIPPTQKVPTDVVVRKYIAPKKKLNSLIISHEDATVILNVSENNNLKVVRLRTGEEKIITGHSFMMGKYRECNFVITGNPTISRQHAKIVREHDGYYLSDLGSANHTYVNGYEIGKPIRIEKNMIIKMSDEDFIIK